MEQEVYIDLYWIVNFSMDLLCVMITAKLLHRTGKRWRAVLAALIGGAYAVTALLIGSGGLLGVLGDLGAALLMCVVAFYTRRERLVRVFQATGVQFLVSVLLGGVMTALYSFLNRLHLPWETLEGDGLSVWAFALLTAVAGVATLRGGRLLGLSHKTKSVTLEATVFGKAVVLRAMVDSGNLLRDPVSGRSVIVADADKLMSVLPPSLKNACRSGDATEWLRSPAYAHRIRLIPTQGATGHTLLPAIMPERLRLTEGKESRDADYLIAAAPLGKSVDGFDALIPPD